MLFADIPAPKPAMKTIAEDGASGFLTAAFDGGELWAILLAGLLASLTVAVPVVLYRKGVRWWWLWGVAGLVAYVALNTLIHASAVAADNDQRLRNWETGNNTPSRRPFIDQQKQRGTTTTSATKD